MIHVLNDFPQGNLSLILLIGMTSVTQPKTSFGVSCVLMWRRGSRVSRLFHTLGKYHSQSCNQNAKCSHSHSTCFVLCSHRICGNAADRNIHDSVSAQLKKNFAKSRWKVCDVGLFASGLLPFLHLFSVLNEFEPVSLYVRDILVLLS